MKKTITWPAAESFALTMPLPITVCPVTRELYGRTEPALNESAARRTLASAGFLVGTPAHEAAMGILEARFDSHKYNSF